MPSKVKEMIFFFGEMKKLGGEYIFAAINKQKTGKELKTSFEEQKHGCFFLDHLILHFELHVGASQCGGLPS